LYRKDRSGPFIISFYALLYDGFKKDLVAEKDCIWLFPYGVLVPMDSSLLFEKFYFLACTLILSSEAFLFLSRSS